MRVASAAVTAALVLATLCLGIWLGGHPGDLPPPLRDAFVDDTTTLTGEAAEAIEDNYFRSVQRPDLNDASIAGMVAELRRRNRDRFSHYFDPEALIRFEEATEGRFSGVGMSVREVPRGLRVAHVFKGAPAARAGLRAGDLVVSVYGHSIAGDDSKKTTTRIKGPPGTSVTLGVLRPSTGRRWQVKLVREVVTVPVVERRLRRFEGLELGYVHLAGFTEGSHVSLRKAARHMRRRGAEGIVLDLRGNGGGLLREAILTSSIFLPKDEVVVKTVSRNQGTTVYRALGDNLPPGPMVVLINRDTASAAEILASALADNDLAKTVGTRSFGKGVFQQVFDLSNGGALDLTIGRYFTADGISLAPKGIEPEVHAEDRPGTERDEGLDRALEVLAGEIDAN
ncbi:MAG: S41 family peptidase [Actinomycetota bacterium]